MRTSSDRSGLLQILCFKKFPVCGVKAGTRSKRLTCGSASLYFIQSNVCPSHPGSLQVPDLVVEGGRHLQRYREEVHKSYVRRSL